MDIRRKLAVTLAAMALVGQIGASMPVAAASSDQIEILQSYLEAGDLAGLAAFIEMTPELLEQGSPLASVLADFLAQFRNNPRLVAFPPAVLAQLQAALDQVAGTSIY